MLMALQAFGIDAILPGLDELAAGLSVPGNDRQFVVGAYLLAAGIGSLLPGALADRFGRRPILLISVACYIVFSVLSATVQTFEGLITIRAAQGFFGAGIIALPPAIIRDRVGGDKMARMMSLIFVIFLLTPAVAPSHRAGDPVFRRLAPDLRGHGGARHPHRTVGLPAPARIADRREPPADPAARGRCEHDQGCHAARFDRLCHGQLAGVWRPVRFHQPEPAADRRGLCRARPVPDHFRGERRRDGGDELLQQPHRRTLRSAPGGAYRAARLHCGQRGTGRLCHGSDSRPCGSSCR